MTRVTKGPKVGDPINHPDHYNQTGIEVIDIIDQNHLGFCLGNVIKYILRSDHKNDYITDLKKARWYLDHHIASLEGTK